MMSNNTKNFLLCLFHYYFEKNNGFIEYRMLKGSSGNSKQTGSKFCTSIEDATSDETYAWLTTHNERSEDIYFGVLPRFRQEQDDESVKHLTSLWADLDKKDFGDDKQKAFNTLLSFPIKPSAIVDSGNGYHAYWFLDCEEISNPDLPTGIMKGMAQNLNGDHTHNLSRILRLPGTFNWKGQNNSLSCLLMEEYFSPEFRYSLNDFKDYWVDPGKRNSTVNLGALSNNLPERFLQLLKTDKRLADTWAGNRELPNDNSHSGFDMSMAAQLKAFSFSNDDIATILSQSPSGKGTGATLQYLSHTIGRAKDATPLDLKDDELYLFHDQLKQPYARIFIRDHWEIWSCRSKSFKRWISHNYWIKNKKPISDQLVKTMINTLESRACFEGKMHPLHTRVADYGGSIWYDLSDEKWRVVKIDDSGWEIISDSPILFQHFNHQSSQIEPGSDGAIMLLLNYVNITDDDQKLLLLIYIVSCFIPEIPHPVLVVHGPQGSAKSILSKIIRAIIDPSVTGTFTMPRKGDELAQMLSHHWCVYFDNLSYLSDWHSDTLCRAVTGDSFAKRELFTNDEDIIFSFKRCIGINGILLTGVKSDLIERSLFINLERISPEKRRDEKELLSRFHSDLPSILGGIFDSLSKAKKIYPSIKLEKTPRMADFSLWGSAIAETLGYTRKKFLEAYLKNATTQKEDLLREDVMVDLIINFAEQEREWTGNSTELYMSLKDISQKEGMDLKKSTNWPKSPSIFSRKLKILISVLSELGVDVSKRGQREWHISTVRDNADSAVNADSLDIFDL